MDQEVVRRYEGVGRGEDRGRGADHQGRVRESDGGEERRRVGRTGDLEILIHSFLDSWTSTCILCDA